MKRASTIVLLVIFAFCGTARAVVDPTPNQMGIFFDQNADSRSMTIGASIPFMMYVILTNPTAPEVSGFEVGYWINVAAGYDSYLYRLANNLGVPGSDLGDSSDYMQGDYVVQFDEPIPSVPSVILVRWQYMLLAPMMAALNLGPSVEQSIDDEYPAYYSEDSVIPVPMGYQCCLVNADCGLAERVSSFGHVKSLYR